MRILVLCVFSTSTFLFASFVFSSLFFFLSFPKLASHAMRTRLASLRPRLFVPRGPRRAVLPCRAVPHTPRIQSRHWILHHTTECMQVTTGTRTSQLSSQEPVPGGNPSALAQKDHMAYSNTRGVLLQCTPRAAFGVSSARLSRRCLAYQDDLPYKNRWASHETAGGGCARHAVRHSASSMLSIAMPLLDSSRPAEIESCLRGFQARFPPLPWLQCCSESPLLQR